jgi:cell division inhibitor SulA
VWLLWMQPPQNSTHPSVRVFSSKTREIRKCKFVMALYFLIAPNANLTSPLLRRLQGQVAWMPWHQSPQKLTQRVSSIFVSKLWQW